VRTRCPFRRSIIAILAFLLAGPIDLAPTGAEPADASPSVAAAMRSVSKVRARSSAPKRARLMGMVLQDQDDPRDDDCDARPIQSAVQPSHTPEFAPPTPEPAVVLAPRAGPGPDLSRLCRRRC
jgi:hypothetical protein